MSTTSFSPEEMEWFRGVIEKHPYSGLLHATLARVLLINEGAEKDFALTQAAIRSTDRPALQAYVFEKPKKIGRDATPLEEKPETGKKPEAQPKIQSRPEPVHQQEHATKSAVDQQKEDKLFEQQFLAETMAAGYLLENFGPEDKEKSKPYPVEKRNAPSIEPQITKPQPAEEGQAKTGTKKEDAPAVASTNAKMTFSAWLQALNSEKPKVTKAPTPKLANADPKAIIDGFIKNEDQIVPKRQEFFNPAKIAKQSLQDQNDIVTETLANIYAAQGNFQKAISTFEKLSLKHPEKSSYFAARIEDLKKNLK